MVIASANIRGDHGLPLDCGGVIKQFQNVVKAIKSRCGDIDVLEVMPGSNQALRLPKKNVSPRDKESS